MGRGGEGETAVTGGRSPDGGGGGVYDFPGEVRKHGGERPEVRVTSVCPAFANSSQGWGWCGQTPRGSDLLALGPRRSLDFALRALGSHGRTFS